MCKNRRKVKRIGLFDLPINKTNSSEENGFSFGKEFLGRDSEKPELRIITNRSDNFVNELKNVDLKDSKPEVIFSREVIDKNVEKIVEKARLVMRRGKGEISMELEPKEMGKIEMKITMEQSKLVAKIKVETQEAKNLFTDSVNNLLTRCGKT